MTERSASMPGFVVPQSGAEPIPGYRLIRRLGCSACGEVWSVKTTAEERMAMKFVRSAGQQSARMIRSLRVVQQLQHPHLIAIKGIWSIPGYIVVGMELADGSLEDLLQAYQDRRGTAVVPEHACLLLADAADALDFLNARQPDIGGQCVSIPHCNVKPSNLLLVGDTLKVADFGLSPTLADRLQASSRARALDYCAPETFRGKLSSQTSQYALAVTYCKLRTGRLPFADNSSSLGRGSDRSPPDLSMLLEVERPIIARALRPVPQDRWPSCHDLAGQLIQELSPAWRGSGLGPSFVRRGQGVAGVAARSRRASNAPA
jgi:serine/threonine protein kinase, bacterial